MITVHVWSLFKTVSALCLKWSHLWSTLSSGAKDFHILIHGIFEDICSEEGALQLPMDHYVIHPHLTTTIFTCETGKKAWLLIFSPCLCTMMAPAKPQSGLVLAQMCSQMQQMHCTLRILLHWHVTQWHNTVPPGHLSSTQRGDPGALSETCKGPSKSSFLPTFLWVWCLQESRRGFAATLAPGTGPLLTHILKLCLGGAMGKAGCCDCTHKKKHLRKKSPPLFTLFYLLL